ncbi:MAG: LD-carboxypeptidase [Thermodesulfobacteriota bacterium]|nr:LD-carboxypeptidase [Thermodesulfobacteriota bacterium]
MIHPPVIKGHRLQKNQTVGVIAPAGPVSKSEIEKGLSLLESYQLKLRLGEHLFDTLQYLAGHDNDRAADLHQMFSDPEIKAIFCARGGYGTARLLDIIDFDIIRKNPKIIVGFSDITALLNTIYKKTGLITIHGPTLSQLPKDNNWQNLSKLIATSYKPEVFFGKGKKINRGKARGILLGGNLSIISSLCGTSFLPSFKNAILFLEDKGESPYRLDRMLTQLLQANVLKELSALIIGQINDCGKKEIIESMLEDRLCGLDIPVITGLPVGHGDENMSLPLGLPALLDTESMVLRIEESAVY